MTREYAVNTRPRREPTHPGEMLREDVLPALGISVSEAARKLRVSRQTLHRILAADAAVTPDMAVRLGKFCAATAPACGSDCSRPMISGTRNNDSQTRLLRFPQRQGDTHQCPP